MVPISPLGKTMLPKAEIHSCSGNQGIAITGLSTAKLWFQWWQNYGYSHNIWSYQVKLEGINEGGANFSGSKLGHERQPW